MQANYESLGLKCGLEIHQQLDTKKLFCNCPSTLRKDEPDFTIKRKLHAIAGESGVVDTAAEYEALMKKIYSYQGYGTTCLVEIDESPPLQINENALKIALQVAILLNCKIFPVTQIMRKTVVDGSNTSGFQRTVLIAHDGWIQTNFGEVKIQTVCLEEDSARIISEDKNDAVYRLDRLGIPLIEIATAPDIKHPAQAKEVALFIGNVLRSCKVKRGIGTIRQDVNVSVTDGSRVEIKGVQEPWLIEKAVELEVKRQSDSIKNKKPVKSEVRKVLQNGETEFLRPMPGAARMYPETDLPLLKIHRDLINEIKKKLPKLRHETEKELKETGLHEEMVKLLLKKNKMDDFKEMLHVYNNPGIVAKSLVVFPHEIASREKMSLDKVEKILNKDAIEVVLDALQKKRISENHLKLVFDKIVDGESPVNAVRIDRHDTNEVEEKIIKIVKSRPGLSANAYMGLIMQNPDFKGKISGKEIMEIISKHVK